MKERDEDEHMGSKGKNKSPMPTVSHASKYQESVNNKQITYSSIYTRSKLQSNITDNRNNNKAATAAATTHTQTHPESFAHVLSRLLRSLIQRNIIYIIIKYGELW